MNNSRRETDSMVSLRPPVMRMMPRACETCFPRAREPLVRALRRVLLSRGRPVTLTDASMIAHGLSFHLHDLDHDGILNVDELEAICTSMSPRRHGPSLGAQGQSSSLASSLLRVRWTPPRLVQGCFLL
jgi:hypothetical protein